MKITPPKLGVLAIIGISTIMTISMHGDVLAVTSVTPVASVDSPGYQLTVNIPSYPPGTSSLGISITTANGYTDHASVAASGVTSWTFNIPANQGWVRVCVNSDNSSGENCNTYNITGADMSVSLSPPSGDSNSYYVYPGNTYYIYPGYRHDYYFHHGDDHGLGGHPYEDNHGYGGHQDGGKIGSGGNGYGGHQDGGKIGSGGNGYGGHQDGGKIGSGGNGYGGHQDGGKIGSGGNGYGGHQDGGKIGSGGNGYGGHQDGGKIGSGGNGYGGHQDRGNNKVAELGSSPPSLGTINVPDDDQ